MLEVMRADYMRTARAKGLSERKVVLRPRPAQRHAPGHHPDRHRLRHRHRRRRPHRDRVLLARARLGRSPSSVSDRDLPVLLGLTLAVTLAFTPHQPARRPVLRVVRPPDPPRRGGRSDSEPSSTRRTPSRRRPRSAASPSHRRPEPAPMASTSSAPRPLRADIWRRFRQNKLAMAGLVLPRAAGAGGHLRPAASPPTTPTERTPGAFREGPSGRALVRHRQHRPRRVLPGRLRRPHLAAGRLPRHRAWRSSSALVLGAIAGFAGGWTDSLIMRFTDIFLAIPYIILAIAVATIFGRSVNSVILVLGLTGWLGICRIVRASFLSLSSSSTSRRPGRSASADGGSSSATCCPTPCSRSSSTARSPSARVILSEAALSFLGVGPDAPTPAWGLMVAEAKSTLADGAAPCCSSPAWPSS